MKGTMVNIIGDSSAGKSFLVLTTLAECANNPRFDNYELVYDEPECANSFDMAYLFGAKAASRIRLDIRSTTTEELRANMVKLVAAGKPFIYVLDSYDALSSEAEELRAVKAMKARPGDKISGTYGGDKQKMGGEIMRLCMADISRTESLFIVVSQAKEKMDAMSFEKKRRAGGAWLDFFSSSILWLLYPQKITKGIKGDSKTKRVIGSRVIGTLKKNKATGKVRPVPLIIYNDYGVDDTESCVDFLVETGVWTKAKKGAAASVSKSRLSGKDNIDDDNEGEEISSEKKGSGRIVAPQFDTGEAGMLRTQLIRLIEGTDDGLDILRNLVADRYAEIEEGLRMNDRKRRYS